MILLSLHGLTRQFDRDPVFRNVTFDVRRGERIGLVGPNGCGKTTLLALLARLDDPDSGRIEQPAQVKVSLLEQQPEFLPGRTLLEEVRTGLAPLYDLQREAEELGQRLASTTDSRESQRLQQRYDEVHSELDRLDAYHIEHRVDEVLQGLGFFPPDYERPLVSFSGGQQNRAILGRMLLAAPDVMLLDEPTNHLDIPTTEWLEGFLVRSPSAMIVVSHDRFFLDRVTNRTLELTPQGIDDYPGNFSIYRRLREERQKVLIKTQQKQEEFIARTEDFIRRNAYGQKHAQAKDREKKLERVERVELLHEITELPMSFPPASRTGDWVIRAEGLTKSFGPTPLFKDLSLQVDRGDRLGILGANGSGKTTLLRILLGETAPDAGQVRLGTNVRIGYFDQQLKSVDPALDAVEAVRPPNDPEITPGQLRSLLARFGVQGELGLQQVGSMSGGERTKVALARLAAEKANVLILDEPTNHLDLWARASLERALRKFDGTLVFVSHDRYFLDQIATRVLVLEPERWWIHPGNYTAFQDFVRRTRGAEGNGPPSPESNSGGKIRRQRQNSNVDENRRKRRFPFRRVEEIEQDITECEARLTHLQHEMGNPDVLRDGDRIRAIREEYEQRQQLLDNLLEHWEESLELN